MKTNSRTYNLGFDAGWELGKRKGKRRKIKSTIDMDTFFTGFLAGHKHSTQIFKPFKKRKK